MKKLFNGIKSSSLIFSIAILTLLGSCKKESAGNNNIADDHYYISFKANGIQKEFAFESFAMFAPQDTSGLSLGLMGAYQNTVGSDQPQLSLLLLSETGYNGPAVFQDPLKAVSVAGVEQPQIVITYLEVAGQNGFQSMGLFSDLAGTPGSYFEHTVADGRATITEITATYVKGTFSATTFKSNDLLDKRIITEGKFYLKRIL